jgi:hypothetical protein
VPYYLFFNSDATDDMSAWGRLRLHKHTIPEVVRIRELARRYMPVPSEEEENQEGVEERTQDLHGFVRAVRRALVGWQKRLSVVQRLRVEAGLPKMAEEGNVRRNQEEGYGSDVDEDTEQTKKVGRGGIVDIAWDATVQEVTVRWNDHSIARLRISEGGVVEKVAVRGLQSGELRYKITSGGGSLEGIVSRVVGISEQRPV